MPCSWLFKFMKKVEKQIKGKKLYGFSVFCFLVGWSFFGYCFLNQEQWTDEKTKSLQCLFSCQTVHSWSDFSSALFTNITLKATRWPSPCCFLGAPCRLALNRASPSYWHHLVQTFRLSSELQLQESAVPKLFLQ